MVKELEYVNTKPYGVIMQQQKLSVTDWLKASFRALTEGGPSAIKAETIAKGLGVSKGSFYWHFANVPALKSSMLSHWKEEATQAIISELNQASDDPRAKLEQLVLVSTSGRETPYGGPMVEAAIRDWARYDEPVGIIVERVDATRIEYVENLFHQYGFSKTLSKSYAKILYSSLIGLQILSVNKLVTPKKELPILLETLLTYQPQ